MRPLPHSGGPYLNELQEKYGEKGLSVLSVARQDRSSIGTFVEELEVKYPTVNEKSDSMTAYGRTSFPSAFLIDTGGRVVWSGHPGNLSDGDIERTLESSRILPPWTPALKDVRKLFDKEKMGEALARLDKHIASERLEAEDRPRRACTPGSSGTASRTWRAPSGIRTVARSTRPS